MSVKLRLLRKGRKGQPFYYIVAADARAPRDGRFIERIGSYNPNTNPATIDLDLDKSVQWLQNGAQPTDTVRAILGYRGALYKNHLLRGAAKGAFPEEEVEAKFNSWMEEKEGRIQAKRDQLAEAKDAKAKEALALETKKREEREKAILAKNSPLAEEAEGDAPTDEAPSTDAQEPEAEVTETVEATTEEAPAVEEPVTEEPAAEETKEEAAEETAEEPKVEESSEEADSEEK